MNKVIGIAGGTGVGKSTLCINLCKKYPERFCLLHLDDYFKKKEDVPLYKGRMNFDHPDAIKFNELFEDLNELINSKRITIHTRGKIHDLDFDKKKGNAIEYSLKPTPIILLEGYLILHEKRIRNLMSLKIYLDMSIKTTLKRRYKFNDEFDADDYFNEVLIPMHNKYVSPTKRFADIIINASDLDETALMDKVLGYINANIINF